MYVDLSDPFSFGSGYKTLLFSIYEKPQYEVPRLGNVRFYFAKKDGKVIGTDSNVLKITEHFEKDSFSDETTYKNSIKYVTLSGLLPNKYDLRSCLIAIADTGVTGCLFTLNSKDLIHTLFKCLYTGPKDCKRDFIVGYSEKSQDFVIQFPNTRFILRFEQVEELCKLIDDFYPHYLKALIPVATPASPVVMP